MIALESQTFIDLSTQYLGSAEAAFELALLNGNSLTDEPAAGRELLVPAVVNKTIASYYANKGLQPATSITLNINNPLPTELEGVGYWAIETEFIIS